MRSQTIRAGKDDTADWQSRSSLMEAVVKQLREGGMRCMLKRCRPVAVDGELLQGLQADREAALKWLSEMLRQLSWPRDWLLAAAVLMDRWVTTCRPDRCQDDANGRARAPSACKDTAEFGGYGTPSTASDMIRSVPAWLAALLVVLKMSEAEAVLEVRLVDVLTMIGREAPPRTMVGRGCTWPQILEAEQKLCHALEHRLAVPGALEVARLLCAHICAEAEAATSWPGAAMAEGLQPKLPGHGHRGATAVGALGFWPRLQEAVVAALEDVVTGFPREAYAVPAGGLAVLGVAAAMQCFGAAPPQDGIRLLRCACRLQKVPEGLDARVNDSSWRLLAEKLCASVNKCSHTTSLASASEALAVLGFDRVDKVAIPETRLNTGDAGEDDRLQTPRTTRPRAKWRNLMKAVDDGLTPQRLRRGQCLSIVDSCSSPAKRSDCADDEDLASAPPSSDCHVAATPPKRRRVRLVHGSGSHLLQTSSAEAICCSFQLPVHMEGGHI
eukprot:TRINITY_DN17598_c0_g1_i4.p1 TRINITY_DN17598_c0_g1~~TRINITY_DN17598_c0_g1_i4.p1  ORF type:complete len:499 (-),score=97.31 TRINITY_DN17598_c0_g1_i4:354-1850(-)